MVMGVDVGGTTTRYVIWDGRKVVDKGKLGWKFGDKWELLKKEAFDRARNFEVKKFSYAVRGVWNSVERRNLERTLMGTVVSDAEGVIYDAYGSGDGMVLVAGTGSVICFPIGAAVSG